MTPKRLLAITGIALLGTGALVTAGLAFGPGGGPGGQGRMLFEKYDQNGDGTVTRAEFDSVHGERFSTADTNKDGVISPDEFKAETQRRRDDRVQMMFDRLDVDNNGVISEEEMASVSKDRFAFLDRNGDDAITKDEIPQRGWFGHGKRGGAR